MSFGDDVTDREPAPAPPDPLASWPAFAAEVRARLEQGRADYGDRSFSADPDELLRELQQEALDLAGWGYVLFRRIEAMREALEATGGRVERR